MKIASRAIIALLVAPILLSASARAGDDKKGRQVAETSDQRDQGFSDFRANLKMVLRDRHGQQSTREVRTRVLEQKDDGDKLVVVFDEPRDVKGTVLLTYTHKKGADDQWLLLPAVGRVKRIASNNQAGPFMGSEFAYEDLGSQEVEKYTYAWIAEESLAGVRTQKVERRPVNEHSGYTRQIVWYDNEHYRPLKIEFYDRKNSHLKTLTYEGYQLHMGKHWRPAKMHMTNHQTGKSTTLMWTNYKFKTGLTDADFEPDSLNRAS